MKLSRLASVILSSAVVVISVEMSWLQSTQASTLLSERQTSEEVIITAKTSVKMGDFVTVEQEKATTGKAKIYVENGKRYLELDSQFSTATGPDVEIILHTNSRVPVKIQEQDYLSLAKLKSFDGSQRYIIPDNVDLDDFQSVAIWCRQFNVTFGFAKLT